MVVAAVLYFQEGAGAVGKRIGIEEVRGLVLGAVDDIIHHSHLVMASEDLDDSRPAFEQVRLQGAITADEDQRGQRVFAVQLGSQVSGLLLRRRSHRTGVDDDDFRNTALCPAILNQFGRDGRRLAVIQFAT